MEKNNVKSGFYEFYPYKLLKSKLTSYVIFNNRKYYTCKYNVIVNNISSPTKKIIVNIE